jgi:metal-dependent amidase/aminoacylase/carboxypeptidase family protein
MRAARTAIPRCCSALQRHSRAGSISPQPAEENEGGGRVMVEEGLFVRFPMGAVYGMHN